MKKVAGFESVGCRDCQHALLQSWNDLLWHTSVQFEQWILDQ